MEYECEANENYILLLHGIPLVTSTPAIVIMFQI